MMTFSQHRVIVRRENGCYAASLPTDQSEPDKPNHDNQTPLQRHDAILAGLGCDPGL